jgi:hypothetical protein
MLFGHQNDANKAETVAPVVSDASVQDPVVQTPIANPLAVDPDTGISLPVVTDQAAIQDDPSVLDQPVLNQPVPDQTAVVAGEIAQSLDADVPQEAPAPDRSAPFSVNPAPVITPTVVDNAPAVEAVPTVVEDVPVPVPDTLPETPGSQELLDLKQQVLSQLSPLVSHLEQSPEEKFRTTMMLIQTTDNPTMLKDAYQAAQAITDEKLRAQALLDVVNEINYFTQQSAESAA